VPRRVIPIRRIKCIDEAVTFANVTASSMHLILFFSHPLGWQLF